MAIYHCSVKIISRSSGRTSVGAAAYRSGTELFNENDKKNHDYTKKEGVNHSEIMLPEHAPEWAADRSKLWNEVEKIEKSSKAQVAREVVIALPNELSQEQHKELLHEYIKENFTDKGMVADFSIHSGDHGHSRTDKNISDNSNEAIKKDNPHAHIMLTMRPFEKDSSWGEKQKKEYILDKNGNKQYDPVKKAYKCKTVKTTDWDKPQSLKQWRENWAKITNKHLEKAGRDERIDHRSYEEQGITDKIPTIHLGPNVIKQEWKDRQKGKQPNTERGNLYRSIVARNKEIRLINEQIKELKDQYTEAEKNQLSDTKIIGRELVEKINKFVPIIEDQIKSYNHQISTAEKELSDSSKLRIAQSIYTKGESKRVTKEFNQLKKDKKEYQAAADRFGSKPKPGFFSASAEKQAYEAERQRLERWQNNIVSREQANQKTIEKLKIELAKPEAVKKVSAIVKTLDNKSEIRKGRIETFKDKLKTLQGERKDLLELKYNVIQNRGMDKGIELKGQANSQNIVAQKGSIQKQMQAAVGAKEARAHGGITARIRDNDEMER